MTIGSGEVWLADARIGIVEPSAFRDQVLAAAASFSAADVNRQPLRRSPPFPAHICRRGGASLYRALAALQARSGNRRAARALSRLQGGGRFVRRSAGVFHRLPRIPVTKTSLPRSAIRRVRPECPLPMKRRSTPCVRRPRSTPRRSERSWPGRKERTGRGLSRPFRPSTCMDSKRPSCCRFSRALGFIAAGRCCRPMSPWRCRKFPHPECW